MEFDLDKKNEPVGDEMFAAKMNSWPECYYREMDAGIRRGLLDEANRQGLTPEDNKIREFLFEKRYEYQKSKKIYRDKYLSAWMEFNYIKGSDAGFYKSRRHVKQLRKLFEEMGEPEIREMGDNAVKILSDEYENCGLRYIHLCHDDKGYKSVIFGFGTVSDSTLAARIYNDFHFAAIKIPESLDMAEELSLWTTSIKRAFNRVYPDMSM